MPFKRVFILLALFMVPSHSALSADMTCKANYFGEIKCKEDSDNGFDDYRKRMLEHGQRSADGLRRGLGNLTGADTRTTNQKRQDYYLQQQQDIARQNKQIKENELAYQRRLKQLEEDDLAHQRRLRKLEYEKALLELELLKKQNESKTSNEGHDVNAKEESKEEVTKDTEKNGSHLYGKSSTCFKLVGYEVKFQTFKKPTCPVGWDYM